LYCIWEILTQYFVKKEVSFEDNAHVMLNVVGWSVSECDFSSLVASANDVVFGYELINSGAGL